MAIDDRFKLVPKQDGDPVFNMAPKNLVDGQLTGTATMVNWLAAQYVNNRLDIKTFDKVQDMYEITLRLSTTPRHAAPRHATPRHAAPRHTTPMMDPYR